MFSCSRRLFSSSAKKLDQTPLQVVPVHATAVAESAIRFAEQRFEHFKAAYERPLATRYVKAQSTAAEKKQELTRLQRMVEQRERRRRQSAAKRDAKAGATYEKLYADMDVLHDAITVSANNRGSFGVATGIGRLESVVKRQYLEGEALDAQLRDELAQAGLLGDGEQRTVTSGSVTPPDVPFVVVTVERPSEKHGQTPYRRLESSLRERRVQILIDVEALQLPYLVEQRLIELVGLRYDAEHNRIKLAWDASPNKAQNRHGANNALRLLLTEAWKADSNFVPLGGVKSAHEEAAAFEAEWLSMMRDMGITVDDPLQLGPALAPAAFVNRVERDIAADQAAANGVTLREEEPEALYYFRIEKLPSAQERDHAKQQTKSLIEALAKK